MMRQALLKLLMARLARNRAGFMYDPARATYIYKQNGSPVPASKIASESRVMIDWARFNMATVTESYINRGGYGSARWVLQMRGEIRDAWRTQYILMRGGIEQMRPQDWGWLGGKLNYEYRRLEMFASDILAGNLSEAQIRARVALYGEASKVAYHRGEMLAKLGAGYTEERRRTSPAEHCDDCLTFEARGWVPIGTLPEPGEQSACMRNCRCFKEYK